MNLPRLDESDARRSPVHRRVVFVLAPDGDPSRRLVDAIDSELGNTVRVPDTLLFRQGLPRIVGNYLSGQRAEGGLRSLAGGREFAGALRALADAPFVAALRTHGGATWLLEWSPEHADQRDLVAAVYPDALVVDEEDVAAFRRDADGWIEAFARTATASVAAAPGHEQRVPPFEEGGDPSSGSAFAHRLVSVFGAPRSGTTWLEQMLLSHPATAGTPELESRIFAAISDCWKNFERPDGRGLSASLSADELAVALRRFCDALFSARRDSTRPGAEWFVEKTPGHARHLDEIRKVYPDGWFVHLVRDGRDVARSMTEFEYGVDALDVAASAWRDTVRAVSRSAGRLRRFREVRYEGLVADPVDAVSELFAWAGLPVDEGIRSRVDEVAKVRVSRHGTRGPVGPGKWAASFGPRDLATVYLCAGDELVDLGYLDAAELASWRRRRVYRRVRRRLRLRHLLASRVSSR